MEVQVSKEAAAELEEAARWYEARYAGVGGQLLDAFWQATRLLRESNPPLTPVLGKAASLGAKKLVLHRFPYSLIVITSGPALVVVAFTHHARSPEFWMRRIK